MFKIISFREAIILKNDFLDVVNILKPSGSGCNSDGCRLITQVNEYILIVSFLGYNVLKVELNVGEWSSSTLFSLCLSSVYGIQREAAG